MPMTSRERVLTQLKGGVPDRIARTDSPWGETVRRWRQEGLGEDEDVGRRFGFDFAGIGGCDTTLRLPGEIIEDCDEYCIQRDANGVLRKDFKRDSGHTPHWLDHTIKTAEDWFNYKERLVPSDDRVNKDVVKQYEELRQRDLFIHLTHTEAYEMAWPVWGQVGIFTMMMDRPDVIDDVFKTYTDLIIALAQKVLDLGVDFDGAFFFGDLGYRNATLFAPALYDRLLLPHHTRMCRFFNDLGKPVMLHSCGRIQDLIPRFIQAGFAAIQPLEAKAGQDVRELKKIFGNQIVFFGNIDIRVMSTTKEAIEEEMRSKIGVAKQGGGYIYHSDHSVPPTVSWENYQFVMECVDRFGAFDGG